jgi:hypothetical protein
MPSKKSEKQELLQRVRQLVVEGHSAGEIAKAVGKTRSAVTGLCHRNGIKLRSRELYISQTRKVVMKKKIIAPPKAKPEAQPKCVKDGKRASPHLPLLNVIPTKSIDKLEANNCRAIGERPELLTLDTLIYCGEKTDGGSWCPKHKAEVFRPR